VYQNVFGIVLLAVSVVGGTRPTRAAARWRLPRLASGAGPGGRRGRVIGLCGQDHARGATPVTRPEGVRSFFGRYASRSSAPAHRSLPELSLLRHEVGHLFGAWHPEGRGSVMSTSSGEVGRLRPPGPSGHRGNARLSTSTQGSTRSTRPARRPWPRRSAKDTLRTSRFLRPTSCGGAGRAVRPRRRRRRTGRPAARVRLAGWRTRRRRGVDALLQDLTRAQVRSGDGAAAAGRSNGRSVCAAAGRTPRRWSGCSRRRRPRRLRGRSTSARFLVADRPPGVAE